MILKSLDELTKTADMVAKILGVKRLDDMSIADRWREYPNDGISYISLDICDNCLSEFKCYLHQDDVKKSNMYNEQMMGSLLEWGEYSFSLLHEKATNLNLRKIIHRIKPMSIEDAEQYVERLFDLANATEYIEPFSRLCKIILECTNSKRYPIMGAGFTVNKTTEKIEEIKLYYSLMRFKNCYDNYCDNMNFAKEVSAKRVVENLSDKKMQGIFDRITREFSMYQVSLALFGINKDINSGRQVNKFYFRQQENSLRKSLSLIRSLHKILFDNTLNRNYEKAIEWILNQGYKQSDICVVSDGTKFCLKICYVVCGEDYDDK